MMHMHRMYLRLQSKKERRGNIPNDLLKRCELFGRCQSALSCTAARAIAPTQGKLPVFQIVRRSVISSHPLSPAPLPQFLAAHCACRHTLLPCHPPALGKGMDGITSSRPDAIEGTCGFEHRKGAQDLAASAAVKLKRRKQGARRYLKENQSRRAWT